MPTATIKFEARGDRDFVYTLNHTKPDVNAEVQARNELLYAHGDTVVLETESGNFSVEWKHFKGTINLHTPFKGERQMKPTNLPNKPFKTSDTVDTVLSPAARKAIREAQGFIAKYEYFITVDTPNGRFTDSKVGTYDC